MVNIEKNEGVDDGNNIVEILARYLAGQIKREDMDENNQSVLSFYLGLMSEDPAFSDKVRTRKNELVVTNVENGKRFPLYTDEELARAKKHKKPKKSVLKDAFQPKLFGNELFENKEIEDTSSVIPEQNLDKLHKEMQGRYSWNHNADISKEVSQKKKELRGIIGLPIARGKDIHAKDKFYNYLVNRIVERDNFGVFSEFDRTITEPSPELSLKINEIKEFVGEVLIGELDGSRYQKFNQFKSEYEDKWKKGEV